MDREININVPIDCVSSLITIMVRKLGMQECFRRIGLNDSTFDDFPLPVRSAYIWNHSRIGKQINDTLFLHIVRKTKAPSLVASSIRNVAVHIATGGATEYKESARGLFEQLTLADVQRLLKIKFSWSRVTVYEVLATLVKREMLPLFLKIPEVGAIVQARLKGSV